MQQIQTLPFLILTIWNRCVCKNYTPKVQYWQFCPTLSKQSLADFCRSKNKNKNKTKMFGNFFSLGFWKNYNDTTSGTFVMVRPVLMQNTRQCGRTIIWHRFHVGNAPSKIHLIFLVSSTFNKYACAQMVYNFGCSKILQRRPVEAVFIILQKKIFITRNH